MFANEKEKSRTKQNKCEKMKEDIVSIKPKVSVFCITYNHEKYIETAVTSFLNQVTDFEYDIVIGDDASTDNTAQIIKRLMEEHPGKIKLVSNKQNLGVFKNSLKTLTECRGKYVAVCEGDDYWIDMYKLQKQFDVLESSKTVSGVYHKAEIINENKQVVKQIPARGKTYSELESFFSDFYQIPTCSVMFRNEFKKDSIYKYRNLLTKSGYIWDFYLDVIIIERGKYIFLDEVMSIYRVTTNTSSFSSQKIEKIEAEMLRTRDNINKYLKGEFENKIIDNKNKIRMSILVKLFRQYGISRVVKKFFEYELRDQISILKNIVRYKSLT